MNNFKLFMCCQGNGITACNSAVYENGDYKTIAHISNAGNIKLYVAPDYIPADDMKRIEEAAEENKKKTLDFLDLHLNFLQRANVTEENRPYMIHQASSARLYIFEQVADHIPLNELTAFYKEYDNAGSQEEKNELLKNYYLKLF